MTPIATTAALSALLSRTRYLLLDFDGPVCAVFAGIDTAKLADQLRSMLVSHQIPDHIATSRDPIAVLTHATTLDSDTATQVEAALTRAELGGVHAAKPTPGTVDVIHTAQRTGRHVGIVSNNSEACVRAWLNAHNLTSSIITIAARTPATAARIKPSPYLVHQALTALTAEPARAVLIGDSPSDVQAAHAAGITCIGYANKPGKHARLAAQHAEVIIESMATVAHALTTEVEPGAR